MGRGREGRGGAGVTKLDVRCCGFGQSSVALSPFQTNKVQAPRSGFIDLDTTQKDVYIQLALWVSCGFDS